MFTRGLIQRENYANVFEKIFCESITKNVFYNMINILKNNIKTRRLLAIKFINL